MLFWYFSCNIFGPMLWSHRSSNSIILKVGQTNWSKGGNSKEFRNCSVSMWTHHKGHQGDLLWQHIRLKLTVVCNKNKKKINWENIVGMGGGREGNAWNISHQKQLQKVTEAQRKRVTKNEREENHQRPNKTDRDAMRNTEREREIKQERDEEELWDRSLEKVGVK